VSRVYFHSPSGDAELRGSERAWLAHLADGPALAAWDLDGPSAFERAAEIVAMVPEVEDGKYGANYLHTYLRDARKQEEANHAAYTRHGIRALTDHEPQHRFVSALKTRLRTHGVELHVADAVLHSSNVGLNTTLVAGSDPIKLAAKIDGWCAVHCWVEGLHREWLAYVIEQGLQAGLYRRGLYSPQLDDGEPKWTSQGWEQVQAFLRARDDEPVVMSYSVSDQFPNASIADWLPAWPDGVPKTWQGYESLTEEQQREREERQEAWYDLDDAEKWRLGMDGLRQRRPWARLTPDSLAEATFGPAVTVYDLFAPDRDARIRAAEVSA